jgi:sugar phosphate isomerase/epimerase
MKINQVAAQLYTARELLKTPADIAKTLKRIRQAGYTAVQVSGMGPIPEDELNTILDGEGLTCCGTHEASDKILNEPAAVVARLKKLRCDFTAYPFPAGIDFESETSVGDLITKLEKSGEIFTREGLILTYHNHNHEFRRLNGKLILDMIYDSTSPKHVQGEPDTYWIHYGGGDVVDWCEKLKNRLPAIHLKDYRTNASNTPEFCEIGAGNLNWPRIISAAEASGCKWFIVEQDVCPGDPVDSLAQSFRYISENLVK